MAAIGISDGPAYVSAAGELSGSGWFRVRSGTGAFGPREPFKSSWGSIIEFKPNIP